MKFTQFTGETMVKAAISGYYGFKNFGDEAILAVLVNHLKKLENVDITVFSSDTDFTSKTYSVNSVKRFDLKNVIKTVKEADILVSGGGSLLQDVTSFKSLVYYSLIIALGLLFNKKVIIFAQGIGPLNSKPAQFIVKNLLKHCSLVTVRDENSLNLLKKWKINANLVCDPIYSLDIASQTASETVGIQLREFKTMNYNLLHKLALLIITKFSDKKIEIFSLQEAQDLELCKRFEQILHTFNPDIKTEIVCDDIINKISKLEYLIAMRFHAVLTALKSGVKTCAVNYDIKVEKLANEAGIPLISMDAHENLEEIYEKMQNLSKDDLLRFAKSKNFDWSEFDKLFFISE